MYPSNATSRHHHHPHQPPSSVRSRQLQQHQHHQQQPIMITKTGQQHHDRPSGMSRIFYSYGKLCASHPWEVIIAVLTLSIVLVSMSPSCSKEAFSLLGRACNQREVTEGDALLVTVTRILALLYVYHQFRCLYKLGSKYLIGISLIFAIFSSVVFSSGVMSVLNGDFGELKTAMPLFLLLADLPKASLLAQFALSSHSREEVRENIARGMGILGPSRTLDTMVETLAMGVGTLSGVERMEELSLLACLSVIVNYIMFMTFFPACLSLALELSDSGSDQRPVWQLSSLTKVLQLESEQAPNPVTQRVKLVMSAGLMLVHTLSRFQASDSSTLISNSTSSSDSDANNLFTSDNHHPDSSSFEDRFRSLLCAEQLVLVALVSALAVKYVFFDSKDNENLLLQNNSIISSSTMKDMNVDSGRPSPETPTITVSHDSDTESAIILKNGTNSSRKNSRRFFIGDDSSSEASSASDEGIIETVDSEVQTIESALSQKLILPKSPSEARMRPVELLLSLINNEDRSKEVSDEEILMLCQKKALQPYRLEAALNDPERGVHIRRMLLATMDARGQSLESLPFTSYDYTKVMGACCENVVGYVPIPVGVAGPLLLNGKEYNVPMATTEGCLVASTNRGCRAIKLGGGATARVVDDFMTRAPCVSFPSATRAAEVYVWLKCPDNFSIIKDSFDSTSRFARLARIDPQIAGHLLFIRLEAETGDAMGMNMLSKGAEIAMNRLKDIFPDMQINALSGNTCTDKKPSANNWTKGRGKKVVAEATIPGRVVEEVLKTDVASLVALNVNKNLIGSAMAGSIGGFNAHAANVVTAVYIATGQDPAQNVGSSNCITLITASGPDGNDLRISVTMPSMEVGTIGGGTILPAQAACLDLLGVRGSSSENPSSHSKELAQIICATVLAGELSILSALAAGHLVRSHMKHNRSTLSMNAVGSCPNLGNPTQLTNGHAPVPIMTLKDTWTQGSCKM